MDGETEERHWSDDYHPSIGYACRVLMHLAMGPHEKVRDRHAALIALAALELGMSVYMEAKNE